MLYQNVFKDVCSNKTTYSSKDGWVSTEPRIVRHKVKLKGKFRFAYYDVTVQHVSHYAAETPSNKKERGKTERMREEEELGEKYIQNPGAVKHIDSFSAKG